MEGQTRSGHLRLFLSHIYRKFSFWRNQRSHISSFYLPCCIRSSHLMTDLSQFVISALWLLDFCFIKTYFCRPQRYVPRAGELGLETFEVSGPNPACVFAGDGLFSQLFPNWSWACPLVFPLFLQQFLFKLLNLWYFVFHGQFLVGLKLLQRWPLSPFGL